jgi:hypothetical protein
MRPSSKAVVLLGAAIVLAVAQALLEDVSVLAAWPAATRQAVRLAGFFLDLYFASEFLARLGLALGERRAGAYLGRGRGWLDFLAGAPPGAGSAWWWTCFGLRCAPRAAGRPARHAPRLLRPARSPRLQGGPAWLPATPPAGLWFGGAGPRLAARP